MMNVRTAVSALALAAALVPAAVFAAEYEVDPVHSNASFTVRHMMVSNVRGEFTKVTGKMNLDEKNISKSTVEAVIDTQSIDTREPKRDDHLRSADFFDVKKYPSITFKSKKVQKAGAGKLKVTGDLTIRDVTREVVLNVEGPSKPQKDPFSGIQKTGASATTVINRKDFGLNWNKALEAGGVVVGDEVKITLDLEFNQAQPTTVTGQK